MSGPCCPSHGSRSSFPPPHPPSPGWNKPWLSLDASEERDGYSSAEEPLHSDAEDDASRKLVSGSLCQLMAETAIPALFCAGLC